MHAYTTDAFMVLFCQQYGLSFCIPIEYAVSNQTRQCNFQVQVDLIRRTLNMCLRQELTVLLPLSQCMLSHHSTCYGSPCRTPRIVKQGKNAKSSLDLLTCVVANLPFGGNSCVCAHLMFFTDYPEGKTREGAQIFALSCALRVS